MRTIINRQMKNKNKKGKKEINMAFTVLKNADFIIYRTHENKGHAAISFSI